MDREFGSDLIQLWECRFYEKIKSPWLRNVSRAKNMDCMSHLHPWMLTSISLFIIIALLRIQIPSYKQLKHYVILYCSDYDEVVKLFLVVRIYKYFSQARIQNISSPSFLCHWYSKCHLQINKKYSDDSGTHR